MVQKRNITDTSVTGIEETYSSYERKGTILYNMHHYGYISKILAHRMVFHKDCDVIILVDVEPGETHNFLSKWNNINSDLGVLYTYSDKIFRRIPDAPTLEHTIETHFDNIFLKIGIDIEKFEKVYSGFDGYNTFGVYLSIKNIEHVIFEMGRSCLRHDAAYERDIAYWRVQKKYRAVSADSDLVSGIIWDTPHNIDSVENVVLGFKDLKEKLSQPEKERIVAAFSKNSFGYKGNFILIPMCSDHPINISTVKKYDYLLSKEGRLLLAYRLFIDYCFDESEKIILKSHPNFDISSLIDDIIPNVYSLPGYYPFELLSFPEEMTIKKIVGIGTSSGRYVEKKEYLFFSDSYFNHYSEMNVIYASLRLSRHLFGKNSNVHCILEGWNQELSPLLDYISEKIGVIVKDKHLDPVMEIIDADYLENTSVKDIIETESKFCIVVVNPTIKLVKQFSGHIALIEIRKDRILKDAINHVGNFDSEFLMIISSNPEIIDSIKNYSDSKEMLRCGITLEYANIHPDSFMKINKQFNDSLLMAAEKGNIEALKQIYTLMGEPGNDPLNYSDCNRKTSIDNLISEIRKTTNPHAMGILGHMYHKGIGVEKDLHKAAEWMRKATEGEVPRANNDLFHILWDIRTSESYKEMISRSVKLAGIDDGNAMGITGRVYSSGIGVEKDLHKAAEWMRKAAELVPGWNNDLFDILWYIGTSKSYEEMISVAFKMAEAGDGRSMMRLGRAYRDGKGVEKNLDEALDWMRKAYEKEWWLGREYIDNILEHGVEERHREAFEICLKIISEHDDPETYARLGCIYHNGIGVEKDVHESLRWLRKAAEKGIRRAKNELFDILWDVGTPDSYKEMISVTSKSAEAGDSRSMIRLGRAYRDGKGVEKNLDEALDWMRKAYEKEWWLGREYIDNILEHGVEERYREAFEICLKIISEHDDPETYARLGRMYRDGIGAEKNLQNSIDYLRKAVDGGVERAKDDLFNALCELNDNNLLNDVFKYCSPEESEVRTRLKIASFHLNDKNAKPDYIEILSWANSAIDSSTVADSGLSNVGLIYDEINQILSTRIYDESQYTEKELLFMNMHTAGGKLRLLQIGLSVLLKIFTNACETYKIRYWAVAGTLLGTARHKGFIPWDDDLDVGMLRIDIPRLKSVIETEYPQLYFNEYTSVKGQLHRAYKIHFRNCKHIFLDIFSFDTFSMPVEVVERGQRSVKKLLNESVNEYVCDNKIDTDFSLNDLQKIEIGEIISKFINENTCMGHEKISTVSWSIENHNLPQDANIAYPAEVFLKTKFATFENIQIRIPSEPDVVLKGTYGDYYKLPNDAFLTRHTTLSDRNISIVKKIIKKYSHIFIESKPAGLFFKLEFKLRKIISKLKNMIKG